MGERIIRLVERLGGIIGGDSVIKKREVGAPVHRSIEKSRTLFKYIKSLRPLHKKAV